MFTTTVHVTEYFEKYAKKIYRVNAAINTEKHSMQHWHVILIPMFELCPETVPSSDDEIEVVGVKWSPQISSTPTKCCSAKQIESAIPKKIKSKCETSE